jgi:hypothetical protein
MFLPERLTQLPLALAAQGHLLLEPEVQTEGTPVLLLGQLSLQLEAVAALVMILVRQVLTVAPGVAVQFILKQVGLEFLVKVMLAVLVHLLLLILAAVVVALVQQA